MGLGEIHPPDISQFKFKQVIHTSCPKSRMVTRRRRSSSSCSLLDSPRVRVFSGHPLLVALTAPQVIKVISKAYLCYCSRLHECVWRVWKQQQGLAECSDWNKDMACLDTSWAVSACFGTHCAPPGALSHHSKVSLSPGLSNPPVHPVEVP